MKKKSGTLKHVAELDAAGLENIDKEDLMIPRLLLLQPGSRAGEPGTYYSHLTGECYRAPRARFLLFTKARIMVSPKGDGGPGPHVPELLCRSADARLPDARVLSPPADSCDTCLNSVQLGGMQAPCHLLYNFLAVVRRACGSERRKGLNLYWISFAAPSIRECKKFLTTVFLRSLRDGVNLFDLEVQLGCKAVSDKETDLFVPTFTIVRTSKTRAAAIRFLAFRDKSVQESVDAEIALAGRKAPEGAFQKVVQA